jgi:hypothetical protein
MRDQERWDFPDELERFIGYLNDGRYHVVRIGEDVRAELVSLVDEWLAAKADWQRFLTARILAGKSAAFCNGTFYVPGQAKHPFLVPIGADGCTEAESIFQRFLLNPNHLWLGGRCRRGACGRYFLRKTAHPKVYCSPCCASLNLSLPRMREARKDERERRIGFAREGIREWQRRRLAVDWKVWVAAWMGDEKGVRITPKSLTIWARYHGLKAPTKGRTGRGFE